MIIHVACPIVIRRRQRVSRAPFDHAGQRLFVVHSSELLARVRYAHMSQFDCIIIIIARERKLRPWYVYLYIHVLVHYNVM